MARPESVAHDHHRMSVRSAVLFGCKSAPQCHLRAEHRKVVSGYHLTRTEIAWRHQRVRCVIWCLIAERRQEFVPGRQPFKGRVTISVIEIVEVRKKPSAIAVPIVSADVDDA